MDHFEDHFHSVWSEWASIKDKWFHGEAMDPVFEGVVRDFCIFDETMHNIHQKVGIFMKGVEQLGSGMTSLSEGVSKGLSHTSDSHISSDSCKLKEATNQIARADAPHSAVAKLRRDMYFNILNPVQNHIANNRNLKVSLDIRRRRLIELNSAKKAYEDCVKRNISHQDRRFLTAQATFESTKMTFNDVDRHVFEWLFILEEYRGDILDSTLQTLKYLQYEFFATSAHAISSSLPARMEFRPMVEMTPEHLEAQVEMELQESEEAATEDVTDFSCRLIEKKARDDPGDQVAQLPVCPLSLSSLLSQGFDEGPARRALRLHQNDTQSALDWLVNGQQEVTEKKTAVSEGVRMPTTVKRVQKLKAMRKAQNEKARNRAEGGARTADTGGGGQSTSSPSSKKEPPKKEPEREPPKEKAKAAPPQDMLGGDTDEEEEKRTDKKKPAASSPQPQTDLLNMLDEEPPPPTDFSQDIDRTSLPAQLTFDSSRCEKQPLAAAVAAGIATNRDSSSTPTNVAPGGMNQDFMSQVQALAAQSQVSPEQLLQAAQQLQAAQGGGGGGGGGMMQQPMAVPQVSSMSGMSAGGGWAAMTGPIPQLSAAPAAGGFGSLDPLGGPADTAGLGGGGYTAGAPAPAAPAAAPKSGDSFGDLVNFTS